MINNLDKMVYPCRDYDIDDDYEREFMQSDNGKHAVKDIEILKLMLKTWGPERFLQMAREAFFADKEYETMGMHIQNVYDNRRHRNFSLGD